MLLLLCGEGLVASGGSSIHCELGHTQRVKHQELRDNERQLLS